MVNYSGVLQADAYAGFNRLNETCRIPQKPCWAHVPRKFVDVHKAHESPAAAEAIWRIGQLYEIERVIRGRSPAERMKQRQQLAEPLLADLKKWLTSSLRSMSNKSETAKAIIYALGL